ncbi:hypothetical protein N656DRAFT_774921 [Canariomyces notabilis]|uniref:Uncharacterized protein n=1 Tax=Canariomyces notabilis TaxID=2074819 RepID=A0AAN6TLF3_9PEZI|nr:hypothetical protein N656DRAFT_774921 [Canariomyces arenarius]
MADRENREYDDAEGSPDPALLYTKEYCIGWFTSPQKRFHAMGRHRQLIETQAEEALARSTKGWTSAQARPLPSK